MARHAGRVLSIAGVGKSRQAFGATTSSCKLSDRIYAYFPQCSSPSHFQNIIYNGTVNLAELSLVGQAGAALDLDHAGQCPQLDQGSQRPPGE